MHPIAGRALFPDSPGIPCDEGYLGPIARHAVDGDTVGLWQFDGDLTDSSGNGFDLTVANGTARYTDVWPGCKGVLLDGATKLWRTVYDTALALSGDVTVEALFQLYNVSTSSHGGFITYDHTNIASSSHNTHWALLCTADNIGFYHRYGAGVGNVTQVDYRSPRRLIHIAGVRRGSDVQLYVNGLPAGPTGTVNSPHTGGGDCRFVIGFFAGGGDYNPPIGCLSSVKVCDIGMTDNQIKAEYNATMGPAFGLLP